MRKPLLKRRDNGQFREGINAPKANKDPRRIAVAPVKLEPEARVTARRAAPRSEPTEAVVFAPLSTEEVTRFAPAMEAAMRTPKSPADRAALAVERRVLEDRFGAIAWAA